MSENTSIAERVLDSLVVAGVLTTEQLASARGSSQATGGNPGLLLLERGAFSEADVERVLESDLGVPSVDLASYAPDDDALELVPAALALELDALPLFEIEGTLTVAIGSPRDVFGLDELGARTGRDVEVVLSSASGVKEAIEQCYGGIGPAGAVMAYTEFPESAAWDRPAPGGGEPYPTPPGGMSGGGPQVGEPEAGEVEAGQPEAGEVEAGEPEVAEGPAGEVAGEPSEPEAVSTERLLEELLAQDEAEVEASGADESTAEAPPAEPVGEQAAQAIEPVAVSESVASAVDLDVLAVADPGRVAVLVAEVLELAVRRGASQIHVLPYKDEFFVVLRVAGRLEQVGHAPRSLESALIDGICAYAHLTPAGAGAPALGRTHVEIAGRAVTLTLSAVPTISGQRLVVAIATDAPVPPALEELGLTATEAQALSALAERGTGLVLVAATVGGGATTTYAALIARAAAARRTVYSVERSLGYEIPSVAQVVAGPGAPASIAAYLDAGLHQDTDVVALNFARNAEEIELALHAASSGRLAIVVIRASDAASAVRRALDLGVEPESLAQDLTLVVAQRLARTVCPTCAVLQESQLASRIPGAESQMIAPVGSGCDACAQTGLGGVTALFEVLPVQDRMRTAIAHSESQDRLAEIAETAGMRSLVAAGLAKVRDGLVSAEELDRVLRFSE